MQRRERAAPLAHSIVMCQYSPTNHFNYKRLKEKKIMPLSPDRSSLKLSLCIKSDSAVQRVACNAWEPRARDEKSLLVFRVESKKEKYKSLPFEDYWHTKTQLSTSPPDWQTSRFPLVLRPPRVLQMSCLGQASKTAPL